MSENIGDFQNRLQPWYTQDSDGKWYRTTFRRHENGDEEVVTQNGPFDTPEECEADHFKKTGHIINIGRPK